MAKSDKEISWFELGELLEKGGFSSNKIIQFYSEKNQYPESIQIFMEILENNEKMLRGQICIVFYDIENDKVRSHIAKFLIRNGLKRIQKSVFLGNLHPSTYQVIQMKLQEVQENYKNEDSIWIVPMHSDQMNNTCVIGNEFILETNIKRKRTWIF